MRTTIKREGGEQRLAIDTSELQERLGCGRHTATEIGLKAGAKIQIGRRVLWNVSKVQLYLDSICK